MKILKIYYKNQRITLINIFLLLFLSNSIYSNDLKIEIQGNQFTDPDVIISLLKQVPENTDEEYSNYIINELNASNLFSEVSVELIDNKYIIYIKEFPNINKIYFDNNDRLDDDELKLIAQQSNLTNLNLQIVNSFIDETEKIYQSFGYNNIEIQYTKKIYEDTNTVDLFFDINEGTLTKINQILITGNEIFSNEDIREIIISKTKSIRNIFANNNYKPLTLERDRSLIIKYYKDNGYLDIEVNSKIEYLNDNKVNIYFNIYEGEVYSIASINIDDSNNILNPSTLDIINLKIDNYLTNKNIFSIIKIDEFKKDISSIIFESGIEFFEIDTFDKKENNKVDVLFQINPIFPRYTKQINIIGNTRTFDYVIRRELKIAEGDAIYSNQINDLRKQLISLNLFESVKVKEEEIDDNTINLIIQVEEKQTGTFNAGVSVGTLDGFAIVTGLRERNFYGTGRSLDVLVNTSKDKNQFKLITQDRLSYENDANINYNINYKQEDFSKASSYKLDTFSSGVGIGYKINTNLIHNIDLEYVLKDYKITDSSTVSNSISSSSGSNMSYLIKNNFRYSTLNPGFISKNGNYLNFNNTIETPTSSSNGFIRNILTFKKYYSRNSNIFAIQAKLGNITSLNNNDILTDDKFALGGRWLRGFDNFGAGPRNSRTSYVGGNNLAVTKLDYSYEITKNSNFPIYLNIFNDYGLIWENKTKPSQSDNNLRSSAGIGLKYYSPIGPIGFTWGFPVIDEEYDIKRMFLFSIGNID
ncbi:outer membrane protein assembly factor BamA [Pelagibacteraceae bacterium]|nr:outer membrane protein assembly factor BamA [Pelagibacteraceae bacterium]